MAELPKLNGDERLFLQTIFTFFMKDGKWPTYNYVERTITRTHPDYDMDAIIKGLPEGFATAFKYSHRYDEEAKLIVPALYYCQEAEEELADFIRVVRHCVDRYYTFDAETPEKDTLEISSNDLSNQLHMQPLTIRKMGLLLQSEYDIAFGFSCMDTECNSWQFPLKRGKDGVSRFREVEAFEQYLEQRTPLAPVQPTRNYTGQTVLQLAKNRPANDAPVVGMGDTQYHIVQGDQYNISGNAREVIFCYAHKDERLLHKLKIQLKSLQREGLVDLWYDHDISAGKEWEHEINKHLNTTQIILLLVSPDFIASDYCYSVEMERAIERHERGEARAIPIILRPTDWHNTPLGKLQALPKDGKPITLWANRDYALLDAARGIRKTIEEMSRRNTASTSIVSPPDEPATSAKHLAADPSNVARRGATANDPHRSICLFKKDPQHKVFWIILILFFSIASAITSLVIINLQNPYVSNSTYTGEVVCNSWEGNVEYVWIVDLTNPAYSGFASVPLVNKSPAAAWDTNMPSNHKYQVHFGCGNLGVQNQTKHDINYTFTGSVFSEIKMQGSTYLAYQR